MEDTLWSALTDTYPQLPMALTAEKLGEKYSVTREQCDEFALQSQERWANGEGSPKTIVLSTRTLYQPGLHRNGHSQVNNS